MTRRLYAFGNGKADGRAEMKDLLGGKGANLAEMSNLGLPVPPGFTISTAVCTAFYENDKQLPDGLEAEITTAMTTLESLTGKRFGDVTDPLLVSVRSGAKISMPGMMDTVLNLGLNDDTVQGLASKSGDPRFAWDSYRRFIQMYADVVLGVDHYLFEDVLDDHKRGHDIIQDTALSAEDWQTIISQYKTIVQQQTGQPFPQDVTQQLTGAVAAVFRSWMTPRAVTYRAIHDIPQDIGTAVTVQAMVFGNMGEDCATGVAFTRNPSTGENVFYGEYLVNAQGEDVVAGIRTPQAITLAGKAANESDLPAMEEVMPAVFAQLNDMRTRLEQHFRDMQDIEFTIERGMLYLLQTRTGKRTAEAALRIAVEMADDGLITKEEAVKRIDPASLDQLLHPTLDPKAPRNVIARGLPASPGAASGCVVFTADEAERRGTLGEKVILCRTETSPEDIHGMHVSRGILTTRGGMTSHAAVVARGMGRPCICGAGEVRINVEEKRLVAGDVTVREGDWITLNGSTGEIMQGEIPTIEPELSGAFSTLMGWADGMRRMTVRTNAETAKDAATARKFGAEGIGLCRTEHMFFEADRIFHVRQMILADTESDRKAALEHLEPIQTQDFVALFKIMAGLPVTIRLLDPPLHEFLPHSDDDIADLATRSGMEVHQVRQQIARLSETNPMLGHRGCRLAISYPEIYEMQARAIFAAAIQVHAETGETVHPEIMIPLVSTVKEFTLLRTMIDRVAGEALLAAKQPVPYSVGTMIELPRAALRAHEIAAHADFFSFGTNDLTQTTYGLSRDDAATFLHDYQQRGIFEHDPFITLDRKGVGELVRLAAERGRDTRPGLSLGICGEHGGDPRSIQFCESLGLDYVSCSPFRVPVARLAAAQAALA